jgi:phosphatidyl-myo-inositol dimannoside synthase
MSHRAGKILFLFSSTLANGGIQRFNRTLIAACQQLGLSCDVLSLQDSSTESELEPFGGTIKFRGFSRSRIRYATAVVMSLLSGQYRIVVIGHINLLRLVVGASLLRWWNRPQLAFVAHGIEVWTGITGSKRTAMRSIWRVLCVSRYTERRIHEQVPKLPKTRYEIFPNALADSWLHLNHSNETDHRSIPVPDRFVLSVTRLDHAERYKGILTVLEAIPMLQDQSIHYVIAGSGSDLEFLRGVADRYGIADRVHFFSARSDGQLAWLYRNCLAFVLPSGKEGFGIVYLEAMYFGAPVIAASEKGVLDVVTDGMTGMLVPYGHTVALVDAITKLSEDLPFRERLSCAGRAQVVAGGAFTATAFVARVDRIFSPATRQGAAIASPSTSG